MPAYVPAFAGTHCAYPRRDGQAVLTFDKIITSGSNRKKCHVDELKEQLTATWHNLKQLITDSVIKQWRKRLTASVKAKDLELGKCQYYFCV